MTGSILDSNILQQQRRQQQQACQQRQRRLNQHEFSQKRYNSDKKVGHLYFERFFVPLCSPSRFWPLSHLLPYSDSPDSLRTDEQYFLLYSMYCMMAGDGLLEKFVRWAAYTVGGPLPLHGLSFSIFYPWLPPERLVRGGPCWLLKLRWLGTQRGQMKGSFLDWFVGLVVPVQGFFFLCLGCSSQPSTKTFSSLYSTLFPFFCLHRTASWAGSRAGSPVS